MPLERSWTRSICLRTACWIWLAAVRARPARTLPWLTGIIFVFAALFWMLIVPAGRGGGAVTVHDSERVGDYDVATLSATRPDDLLRWLADHGFNAANGRAITPRRTP